MRLIIRHNNTIFEPPVKSGVKIEWERKGSPGKLTFTTVKIKNAGMSFTEGDPVWFYYHDKPVFAGYVFTKKRDREHHIEVTCYDQIRYLKNKYTYSFENKTSTEIIKSLANDFDLTVGEMDNTQYVHPSVTEENKSAMDIILDVLEDTLTNTGNMYVLYDDFGKLYLKDCANMTSRVLISNSSAENFDYSSTIDDETYNDIMLYYTNDEAKEMQLFPASSEDRIKEWGVLRYFEQVKYPAIGQHKANTLLKLYNRKTRKLTIQKAFGSTDVRGGTLIPVVLDLGDIRTNNYMLVEKAVHNFDHDYYTMDLTLEGAWEE